MLLLVFPPLLWSCGVKDRLFIPALDTAFTSHVTGTCGGEPFAATVTAGAWETGEDGARTRLLRVVYTAPEHLRGLVATLDAGKCSLTLDGMEVSDAHLFGFLVPARLLGDAFTVTNTYAERTEGREVCFVFGSSENGSRQVQVDSESGEILSVEGTLLGIYAEFSVESLESLEQ